MTSPGSGIAITGGAVHELGWIAKRYRGRLGSAVALSLAFKALNLAILAPLSAAILRFCLTRWGRASVGNFELVAFFLSPAGIAALLAVGGILLASTAGCIGGRRSKAPPACCTAWSSWGSCNWACISCSPCPFWLASLVSIGCSGAGAI
jgi:hypothetical protein